MRKEAKTQQTVTVADIQGYHGARTGIPVNYAFRGFTENYYFNSDRKERTVIRGSLLYRENGQPLAGYGLEIETECRGVRNATVLAEVMTKIVFPAFKFGADMWKMQEDGSLGGDTSVEVISQVMTKSRIRNDYAAYKTMFNTYFPAFGISADSYQTFCGMHVNVSNAIFGKTPEQQADNVRKLYYIVNRHYDFACKLFYRSPERTRYCGRMAVLGAQSLDLNNASSSHGNCMNLSHFPEGRIEIRLVGGQKDYFCFRNTMESVFFLCERVKSLTWAELDDLPVIFRGCNQYVYKRLSTECRDFLSDSALTSILATVREEDLDLRR